MADLLTVLWLSCQMVLPVYAVSWDKHQMYEAMREFKWISKMNVAIILTVKYTVFVIKPLLYLPPYFCNVKWCTGCDCSAEFWGIWTAAEIKWICKYERKLEFLNAESENILGFICILYNTIYVNYISDKSSDRPETQTNSNSWNQTWGFIWNSELLDIFALNWYRQKHTIKVLRNVSKTAYSTFLLELICTCDG